jgi:hypothetical protein
MRRWLTTSAPTALLGWDGQLDTGAFWDAIDWDDYRGADGHE